MNAIASNNGSIVIGRDSISGSPKSIAIGYKSIAGKTYGNSIAIGVEAEGEGIVIGDRSKAYGNKSSIAIGYGVRVSDNSNSSLSMGNIAIGQGACSNVKGGNKVCIGYFAGPKKGYEGTDSTDIVDRIYIGPPADQYSSSGSIFEIHNYRNGSGKNPVVRIYADLEVIGENKQSSDRRLKYVGKENTSGLDKIRQLKVFNYTLKIDEKKTPHVGVIAQDLQKIFPDAVKKGVDGFLSIRFEDMFYAMINAIKELDSRITALEKENAELKKRLEVLEAKIK